ncbi:hypothetical protein PDESU_04912 [Pontiella desulfatans]|uniref:Uncharacterized protein n=1 Tax=Pontiella desulfatans TaxID=2750659 RepID=A0A6C2U9X7_PONDE|nr:hypothetical protein PDESU_04912 [Pontiella desulfatans]
MSNPVLILSHTPLLFENGSVKMGQSSDLSKA